MTTSTPQHPNLEPHLNIGGSIGILRNSNVLDGEIGQVRGKGVPHSIEATQTEVSGILLDASRTLSPEETSRAKDQARESQERVELFIQEVERVREGFGYGYDSEDYIKRLSVSDEVFERVFERILSENKKLRICYEGITRSFSGDKEKLKVRIMKNYGDNLVYEGMKKEEYGELTTEKMDFTGKSAKEAKDMLVEFAGSGGKWLDLSGNGLNEVFRGEPNLFKEMVIAFAKAGGKFLDLGWSGLDEIFAEEPELFMEMVVGFAKNGGESLNLKSNGMDEVFLDKQELFISMVAEFAKNGGRGLALGSNGLHKLFKNKPGLLVEMVVNYAMNTGRMIDINKNQFDEIFAGNPELFKDMVVEFAKAGGKTLNIFAVRLSEIFKDKPELFKDMVVDFLKSGGKNLNMGGNSLEMILSFTLEVKTFLIFLKKEVSIKDAINKSCKKYQGEASFDFWNN